MHSLIFIKEGTCNLVKRCTMPGQPDKKLDVPVVSLPEGSWYGDFHIMTDQKADFSLVAALPNHKDDSITSHMIQVYRLPGEVLLRALNNYPVFSKFARTRALQRRSHFQQVYKDNLAFLEMSHKLELQEIDEMADLIISQNRHLIDGDLDSIKA